MTQSEINEAEWQSRANWRWGCYSSPRDERVWVPKPIRWAGWTLNLAHRAAWYWLLALIAPAAITIGLVLMTAN